MAKQMTEENWWHIDALDATAGSAFASYRAGNLLDATSLSGPAYHIEAPYFRAQQVASRTIGMASTRAGHQLGLFDENGEIPFNTLEDLTEFVRRAYLSSGGGDGAGGGGGGPRPPLSPEGGEGGPRPMEPEDYEGSPRPSFPEIRPNGLTSQLLDFSKQLREPNLATPKSESFAPQPTLQLEDFDPFPTETNGADESYAVLSFAASALLLEFLLRFPKDRARLGAWEEGYWRLRRVIAFLKLSLLDFREAIEDAITKDEQLQDWIGYRPGKDERWLNYLYREHYDPHYGNFDVFDTLSLWPVPPDVDRAPDFSVRDYLVSYLANPRRLDSPAGAAILVMASACIVSSNMAAPWRRRWGHAGWETLVCASLEWLKRQLPSTFFDAHLEKLIEDARDMRTAEYRGMPND